MWQGGNFRGGVVMLVTLGCIMPPNAEDMCRAQYVAQVSRTLCAPPCADATRKLTPGVGRGRHGFSF